MISGVSGYADDFVRNLLNLMIISKMNATIKNLTSKNYFIHLISQIDCCEAYVVKYGQPPCDEILMKWNLLTKR